LDRKNKSLLRINADHDNFVHTASHDLLAPLGNIELSINVLNNKITDPSLNQFLTVLNSSVKKFRSLITDISIIAKIEGEMISLELIDIEEVLTNILWSLEDKINTANVKIVKHLEVKQVLFSKNNLRSILYNLISNAIKFNDSKIPEIIIKTYKENDKVVLSVQDNGIGMEQADLNKIFDLYGRLHHQIEGHGIGLYLAKKIIDAAEGDIIVESEPGKGSKFMIHF